MRRNGLPAYLQQEPDFPFVVISPQLPPERDRWDPDELKELLLSIVGTLHVDRDRMYLTGWSLGATGTWETAMRFPRMFAAIAPVAGDVDCSQAGLLKGIPIWVFHGADDTNVPVFESINMVEALQEYGVDVGSPCTRTAVTTAGSPRTPTPRCFNGSLVTAYRGELPVTQHGRPCPYGSTRSAVAVFPAFCVGIFHRQGMPTHAGKADDGMKDFLKASARPLARISRVGAVALAFVLREVLSIVVDPGFSEYLLFYPTVMIVALLAGSGRRSSPVVAAAAIIARGLPERHLFAVPARPISSTSCSSWRCARS